MATGRKSTAATVAILLNHIRAFSLQDLIPSFLQMDSNAETASCSSFGSRSNSSSSLVILSSPLYSIIESIKCNLCFEDIPAISANHNIEGTRFKHKLGLSIIERQVLPAQEKLKFN